ncbi:hypothetical protein VF04_01905 [Nostoc linckia z7]|uniref:Uncharacterized protein n=2 Tax=Nostoc linckia TaxID=92942 RepID=A0A9Q6EJG3_NOSLI|nr:hypothetical protein VF05_11090 [Nostoc linckia z3]PHJ76958.1 hypothetical protein VF03_05650 [Nostoc linckia z2]PHK00012.1 hypothetical protein VF08_24630 [Nostoc linckia z8]PHK00964.1 hypothetical protein VF04_01905 [Nostoc linckia z7]
MGHWAWGIGHGAWEEDKVDKVDKGDKVAIFLSEVLMVGNLRSDFSPCLPCLPPLPISPSPHLPISPSPHLLISSIPNLKARYKFKILIG